MHDDQFYQIIKELSEIKADVQIVKTDIERIKDEDSKQNELLDIHIKGVETNTARLNVEIQNRQAMEEKLISQFEDLNKRLEIAEIFPKIWIFIRKAILWVGAPITVIFTILRLLGYV